MLRRKSRKYVPFDPSSIIPETFDPLIDRCQCCLSVKDLRSITEPHLYNEHNEIYSHMLSTCFTEMKLNNGRICACCVRQLRAVLNFKLSVQSAQDYLKSYPLQIDKNLQTVSDPTALKKEDSIGAYSFKKSNFDENFEKKKDNITKSLKRKSDGSGDDDDVDDDFTTFCDQIANLDAKGDNSIVSKQESSEDENVHFSDFLNVSIDAPKQIFKKPVYDVGEQRTLPYVLDSTDRKCEICGKEFSFLGDLLNHMPEHYPNHICDICGKICATRKSYTFHAKIHTDNRLNCKLCDKSFKNKSNLNAHVKVRHKGEKISFKCSQCGEVLNTYNARIKHMAEKHGREDKAYKCAQCPCKYRLGSHLRAHIRRVHLQEKNHKCQICGYSFFTRKSLENHSLKHSGEKNFTCSICHKSYGRKESLRQHVKSHEEEKNYTLTEYPQQCQEYVNQL